jgi:hypothetical protein
MTSDKALEAVAMPDGAYLARQRLHAALIFAGVLEHHTPAVIDCIDALVMERCRAMLEAASPSLGQDEGGV